MWHHDDDYGRGPSKRPDNLIRQVKHCFLISRFFGKKLLFVLLMGLKVFDCRDHYCRNFDIKVFKDSSRLYGIISFNLISLVQHFIRSEYFVVSKFLGHEIIKKKS